MKNLAVLLATFSLATTVVIGGTNPAFAHGSHSHHHEKKPHQEGIFEDEEVKDRALTDWSGDWQSVYPYLKNNELDMVMRHKANAEDAKKTFEEYKEYYLKGYETDVDRIIIDGETGEVSFYRGDDVKTVKYEYVGYKILTYESGKKGVRYLFTAVGETNGAPKHFQFSDHEISPTIAHHFHLYFGDESHEELLKELENWPTYYPADLDVYEIIDEMIAH
ncbi:metal-binding protein ZinT [Aerococcaceae bacterium NML201209]|nr:metal-binding protein ZinT [Aerococcaceae bacterium NML201209]